MASKLTLSESFAEFWRYRGNGEKVAIIWLSIVFGGLVVTGIALLWVSFWWGVGILGVLLAGSVCAALGYLGEENNW